MNIHNLKTLVGQRFTRLVVLKRVANFKNSNALWFCQCDCGGETITTRHKLMNGHTKSCGCLRHEFSRIYKQTHGLTRSREHRIWSGIKTRCFNPKMAAYKDYGGRGITMCPEWKDSFETFLRDMGPCPEGKSIDRFPNHNGNYEPGNCRWATPREQALNTRRSVFLTMNGETLCMNDWAKRYGISHVTISRRLSRGWTHDMAILGSK